MLENIMGFFKKLNKNNGQVENKTNKDEAKERLHLVLMQDRANVSADFLDMMRQEIIEVIKKYIDVDESEIDVRLTNKPNSDGTTGAPALYANIPIKSIKNNDNIENSEDEPIEKVEDVPKIQEEDEENNSELSDDEDNTVKEEQNNTQNEEKKEAVKPKQSTNTSNTQKIPNKKHPKGKKSKKKR